TSRFGSAPFFCFNSRRLAIKSLRDQDRGSRVNKVRLIDVENSSVRQDALCQRGHSRFKSPLYVEASEQSIFGHVERNLAEADAGVQVSPEPHEASNERGLCRTGRTGY